ncbi:MAG: hypothetical protein ACOC10_08095 [Bacteroidota bacterium]
MKNFELLTKYLDGNLSPGEKGELEKKLREDPAFSLELEALKDTNEFLEDNETFHFAEKTRKIIISNRHKKKYRRLTPVYKIAAGILVIAALSVIGYFIVNRLNSYSSEELFARYYTPYSSGIATRSPTAAIDKLLNAIKKYEEGKYQEALGDLKAVEEVDPTLAIVYFYKGLCNLELENFNECIGDFKSLDNFSESPYHIHGKWYLSLVYVKTKQLDEARSILNELKNNSYYKAQAEELLTKINK